MRVKAAVNDMPTGEFRLHVQETRNKFFDRATANLVPRYHETLRNCLNGTWLEGEPLAALSLRTCLLLVLFWTGCANSSIISSFKSLTEQEDRRFMSPDTLEDFLVRHPEPSVRSRAALAAARLRDSELVPILVRAVRVELDDSVLASCLFAIGQIGDSSAIPSVMLSLHDRAPAIRAAAAEALGKIGDDTVVAALVAQLEDPEAGRATRGGAGAGSVARAACRSKNRAG